MMEKRWLTIREVAEYLGAHEKTIYIWSQIGLIQEIKFGGAVWADRKALDRTLEEHQSGRTTNLESLI